MPRPRVLVLLAILLIMRDPAAAQPLRLEDLTAKLPDPYVTSLAFDGERVWIGTWKGAAALDPATLAVARFTHLQGLECPSLTALAARSPSEVYAGASHGVRRGLYRYDGREFRRIPLPVGDANVTALLATPAALYIGTFGAGLLRLANGTVEVVAATPAHITALAGDDERLYAATRYSGVLVVERGAAAAILDDHTAELAHNCVAAALARSTGEVWFGHWGGASLLTPGGWESFFRHERQLPHHYVKSLAADAANVYLGTGDGISVYGVDRKSFMNLQSDKFPMPSGNVLALLKAGKHLYAGTDKGLIRIGIGE